MSLKRRIFAMLSLAALIFSFQNCAEFKSDEFGDFSDFSKSDSENGISADDINEDINTDSQQRADYFNSTPPVLIENAQGPLIIKPRDFAVSKNGRVAYVTDFSTSAVYKVDLTTGRREMVSSMYHGSGPLHRWPGAVVISPDEETVYVSAAGGIVAVDVNTGNRVIVSGVIAVNPLDVYQTTTTFKGSGPQLSVKEMALSPDGMELYTVGWSNTILGVNIQTGDRRVIFESSENSNVEFKQMSAIALNSAEGEAFVFDSGTASIVRISLEDGAFKVVSNSRYNTEVGSGPSLSSVEDLAVGPDNSLYVGGYEGIIKVNLSNGNRSYASGGWKGVGPDLHRISKIALVDSATGYIIEGLYGDILKFSLSSGDRSYVSRSGYGDGNLLYRPRYIAFAGPNQGDLVVLTESTEQFFRIDTEEGHKTEVSSSTKGSGPDEPLSGSAMAANPVTGEMIVGAGRRLYKLNVETGARSLLVGDIAQLDAVRGLTVSRDGTLAYVVGISGLFRVNLVNGSTTKVSGGSVGAGIEFEYPRTVAYSKKRNKVYVGDRRRVVEVDLQTGHRSILSGDGVAEGPGLSTVNGLMINGAEDKIYLVTIMTVKEVDLSSGDRKNINVADGSPTVNPNTLVQMTLDPTGQFIYATDRSLGVVFQFNISTGTHKLISR